MRRTSIALFVAAMSMPVGVFAGHTGFDSSSGAIKTVVSGKTCIGSDTLRFGKIGADFSGTFERTGKRPAEYHVGEGTILILRDGDLHGYVTSVSVPDRMLYMSVGKYRC